VPVVAVIFVAFVVQSAVGFGAGLISMPVLVVLVGLQTASPLMALVGSSAAAWIAVRNRRQIQFGEARRLLVTMCAGVPVGLAFLKGADPRWMQGILGAVVLGYAVYGLWGRDAARIEDDRAAYAFGFVAGLLGGAFATAGPPVVIYGSLRRWDPGQFRATLQGFFVVSGAVAMFGHAVTGLWTVEVWSAYLASLPAVAVATWAGSWIHGRVSIERFRPVVNALLFAIGCVLLLRCAAGM
jgi:uncharacterized membrane protein YfcA